MPSIFLLSHLVNTILCQCLEILSFFTAAYNFTVFCNIIYIVNLLSMDK
jgi:hypothetical protein